MRIEKIRNLIYLSTSGKIFGNEPLLMGESSESSLELNRICRCG